MFLLFSWMAMCVLTLVLLFLRFYKLFLSSFLWPDDQFSLKKITDRNHHQSTVRHSLRARRFPVVRLSGMFERTQILSDWEEKKTHARESWSGWGRETASVSSVSLSTERNPLWLAEPRALRPCVYLSGSISVAACERPVCNHSSGRPLLFRRPGSSCGGNTSDVKQRGVDGGAASRQTRQAGCKLSGSCCVTRVGVVRVGSGEDLSFWSQLLMTRWKHSTNNEIF